MNKKSIEAEVKERIKQIEFNAREHQRQIKEQYIKQAEALGQETRQRILDTIKKGKKLGEVAKEFNTDVMVVCEILTQNIEHADYLRSEAI